MREEPRNALERLCRERGENFASLSRLIGKNSAYIQQFIRKGTPRRLGEEERGRLASYFGVSESLFGGPNHATESLAESGLVTVPRTEVRASAGPGAIPASERATPYFGFDPRWLKAMTASPPGKLSVIRVEGDSMVPTLAAGDDILVDLADCGDRLRDGIYVLRVDDALVVKRLALHPMGRRVTVQSDNPAYADWPDCSLEDIHCIGRVIWAGRKIG